MRHIEIRGECDDELVGAGSNSIKVIQNMRPLLVRKAT